MSNMKKLQLTILLFAEKVLTPFLVNIKNEN